MIKTIPDVFANRADLASDVWNQDIVFEKGKTYLVEANSGTGKSSLCSFIYGYRNDYQGQILFDGVDTRNFSISQWTDIRKRHFSLMWQELRLFPELTAMENVVIKNKLTGKQKKKRILEWFDMLGISEKVDSPHWLWLSWLRKTCVMDRSRRSSRSMRRWRWMVLLASVPTG